VELCRGEVGKLEGELRGSGSQDRPHHFPRNLPAGDDEDMTRRQAYPVLVLGVVAVGFAAIFIRLACTAPSNSQ